MMRALTFPILVAGVLLATASAAAAQEPPETEPIGRFVLDARAVVPRFQADPILASALDVVVTNMPKQGFGYAVGGQVYPFRKGPVTFGFGGEVMVSTASLTLEPTTEGGEPGPTVNRKLTVVSPTVSLNFGKRQGWSYLTGGVGYSTFTLEREAEPTPPDIIVIGTPVVDPTPQPLAINYGGGARWFLTRHIALTMDLRFYRIQAQPAGVTRAAIPKTRVLVLSIGTAFK